MSELIYINSEFFHYCVLLKKIFCIRLSIVIKINIVLIKPSLVGLRETRYREEKIFHGDARCYNYYVASLNNVKRNGLRATAV